MLFIKYVLITAATALFGAAAAIVISDIYQGARALQPTVVRWRPAMRLALIQKIIAERF